MPPTKCSWQYWTQWSKIYQQFWHNLSVISILATARLHRLGMLKYLHHISLCHVHFQNFGPLYNLQPLPKTTLQIDGVCRTGKKECRRRGVYTHN